MDTLILLYIFVGVAFHSRATGACLGTTDLTMRVNVRTTTSIYEYSLLFALFLLSSASTAALSALFLIIGDNQHVERKHIPGMRHTRYTLSPRDVLQKNKRSQKYELPSARNASMCTGKPSYLGRSYSQS